MKTTMPPFFLFVLLISSIGCHKEPQRFNNNPNPLQCKLIKETHIADSTVVFEYAWSGNTRLFSSSGAIYTYYDTFEYNHLGQIIRQAQIFKSNTDTLGYSRQFEYDVQNRLIKMLHWGADDDYVAHYLWSGTTRTYNYATHDSNYSGSTTYDEQGNTIRTIRNTNHNSGSGTYLDCQFEYDAQNRLIKKIEQGDRNVVIDYSWSGNTQTYAYTEVLPGGTLVNYDGIVVYNSDGYIVRETHHTNGEGITKEYEYACQ